MMGTKWSSDKRIEEIQNQLWAIENNLLHPVKSGELLPLVEDIIWFALSLNMIPETIKQIVDNMELDLKK